MSGSVAIVGGGIIGVTSAWYLHRAGWQVTVLDKGVIGGACSKGNCGLVCPSHVLPLTEPGAIKQAVKAMLSPGSPFRIKPRTDPALWSWLWHFARRCNHSSMTQAAHAIQAMLASSITEYEHLVHQDKIECEWQNKGLLFAYASRQGLDAYDPTNQLLTDMFNEPARKLDTAQVLALEPALLDRVAGGWYYEHDAHLRPDVLLASLRERLEAGGVTFIENCEFQGFSGGRPTTVGCDAKRLLTSGEDIAADVFLFASGAWSPKLQSHLGCKIPIEPGKGYSITMPRPDVCPEIPLIFPEHRVAVTPMQTGYRLGSIMEFAGWDESLRPERLELLRRGAKHYLKQPYCEPELETWYGWRPMTYDGVPLIDRSPLWNNVWMAAGHNMLGLSMATGTGRLVSELLAGSTPHLDPAPYQLARFG